MAKEKTDKPVEEKTGTVKLKFSGDVYHGHDPVSKADVNAVTDEVVEVSTQKADQLLADFPKEWKKATKSDE